MDDTSRILGKYKYVLKKENVVKVDGKDSVRAGLKLVQGSVSGDRTYTLQQRFVEGKLVLEQAFDDWNAASIDAERWIESSYDVDQATKLEKADADLYAKIKQQQDFVSQGFTNMGTRLDAATNIAVGGADVNAAINSLGTTPAGNALADAIRRVSADGKISVAEITQLLFALTKYITAADAAQAANSSKAAGEISALQTSLRETGHGVSNLVAKTRVIARRIGLEVPREWQDQVKAGWLRLGKASIDLDGLIFNLIVLRGTTVTASRPEGMLDAVLGSVEAAKPVTKILIRDNPADFAGKKLKFAGFVLSGSGGVVQVSDGSEEIVVAADAASIFEFQIGELHLVPTIGGIALAGLYKYARGEYGDSYLPQLAGALSESIKSFGGFANALPNFGK